MSRIANPLQDNVRQQGNRSDSLNTIANRGKMKNNNSRRSASSSKASPSRNQQKSSTTTRRSTRSSGVIELEKADEGEDDLTDLDDVEDALFNSRHARSNTTVANKNQATSSRNGISTKPSTSHNTSHSPKRKSERKKEERKASVRKEKYDLDATDSELSDAPEEVRNEDKTGAHTINVDQQNGGDDDNDLNLTESDSDMAERLQAAGDGESLLGSAISDREGGDTDKEEERFIIEDSKRRRAKASARRQREGSTPQRTIAPSKPLKSSGRDDDDPYHDNGSGSLSPQTLQQLGLDELFEGFDGLQSSSEPSFTDFFMSDSEDGTDDDGLELAPLPDDDQLTTDDGESGSDISDLEDGLMSAPFLADALAAGAGTQMVPSAEAMAQADIPLLVIEDLDGRLIYARAGDGEAVFGSDGEFEFVDDSEEDSDEDDEAHFPMDGFNGTRWTHWRNDDGDETDDGETTDEYPNEDMPFPRLLVGSVAPHGGRNARRARALAARSRRISPSGLQARSRESSTAQDVIESGPTSKEVNKVVNGEGNNELKAANILQDVDFSISTEDLARDPKATLEAAAKSLGLTVDEVAQLVIGTAASTANGQPQDGSMQNPAYLSPEMSNNTPLPGPMTPEQQKFPTFRRAPLMGCFIPSSSKGVHRAVIDGSNQAPSPFANRFGTQRKGLATGKKRQPSSSNPTAKRLRRESNTSMAFQSDIGDNVEGVAGSSSAPFEAHEQEDIDEMDLDDVMDSSMMWRGPFSSSPTQVETGEKVGSVGKKSPAFKASSKKSPGGGVLLSTSPDKTTGLNMSAVARWHKIPMGAFRESQVTSSQAGPTSNVMANQQQPLGSFLLTRSRGLHQNGIGRNNSGNSRSNAEHSPFRGRTRGDSIHLGPAPKPTSMRDAFMISPILWPSNGNGKSINAINNASGNGQIGYNAQSVQISDPTNMRKMTTRREKRERKARRDALKAALQAVDEDGNQIESSSNAGTTSPSKNSSLNGSALLESPSTALPRLSITDASPHGSPLASKSKPLPPSGLSKEVSTNEGDETVGLFAKPEIAASAKQQQNRSSATPIDIPSSVLSSSPSMGISIGSGNGNQPISSSTNNTMIMGNNSLPTTSPSSSLSSQHQPPSSVFGMPLHSPLFGSILNPPNLGFRDDLDERDEEGILTI